jgi:hypothetical protein
VEQYHKLVSSFLIFCENRGLSLDHATDVDVALNAKLNEMFLEGMDIALGSKLVAGWQHFFPRYGRHGDYSLPRALRALKGWRRLGPPRSRVGITFFEVAAIAARLCQTGYFLMCVWVLLGHAGYLGPSTNMGLRRACLVPPVDGVSKYWGLLLLHASEFGMRSKTGSQDDAVLLDSPDLLWLGKVLPLLKVGRPEEKIWPFTYHEVVVQFAKVCKELEITAVPYQLRHTGPSWDRLQERRSLQEIQKRGQWKAHSSVPRYEKSTRVMATYSRQPASVRRRCEALAAELETIVLCEASVRAVAASQTRRGLR